MAEIMLGKSSLLGEMGDYDDYRDDWAFEGEGSYMHGHSKEIQTGKKYTVES